MGLKRALSLGIIKGQPTERTYVPICPKEHDPISLERLLSKSKAWKTAKWVADKGSQMIGQQNFVSDEMVLAEAMLQHDKECVTGPETKWCRCDYCSQRRTLLRAQ